MNGTTFGNATDLSSAGPTWENSTIPPGETIEHPTKPNDQYRSEELLSPRPASLMRLYLMVASDFGLSFVWVIKYGLTTPFFQHTLLAGAVTSHLVWILGPLSGLITAPIIGAMSDRCKLAYGRRRPFMLGGSLACVTGMFLFAESASFPKRLRLPLAVVGFGVLDFATNIVMFPSRALLGDLLPANQQHDAQSAAAVLASLAEIAAGAFLWALKEPITYVRTAFAVAAVVLLATTAVSLFVCKERQLQDTTEGPDIEMVVLAPDEDSVDDKDVPHVSEKEETDASSTVDAQASLWREVYTLIRDAIVNFRKFRSYSALFPLFSYSLLDSDFLCLLLPFWAQPARPLVLVGIVYGLAWLCWFACLPYYSAWIGDDVVGGSSTAPPGSAAALLYQQGVSVFAGASMAKAGVSLAFSAIYPSLLRLIGVHGEKVVFSLPFAVFGVVLAIVANTRSRYIAAGVVVLGAIPFVATQTIPIAIVVQRFPERLASNLGVLNLFCVMPQLVDTLYTGPLAARFTEVAVMRAAATWAIVVSVVSLFLL